MTLQIRRGHPTPPGNRRMRSSIGLAIESRGEVYDGRRMIVDAFSFEFRRRFGFMGRFFFVVLVIAVVGVEKGAFFGRVGIGDGAAVRV